MSKKSVILFLTLLLVSFNLVSQNEYDIDKIKKMRLNKIDFYHISLGINSSLNKNFSFGLNVGAGIGSHRNLINCDLGVGLVKVNPFYDKSNENISLTQMPLYLSSSINFLRWKTNSIYLGTEFAYVMALNSKHYNPVDAFSNKDLSLRKSHCAASVKIGAIVDIFNLFFFYEYDLAPSFNQKYIYESPDYDYVYLRDKIFERYRFGISLSYILRYS